MSAPTVRDLLAGAALAGARLAGGAAGLDAPVRSVVLAERVDRAAPGAGAAVMLAPPADATNLDADVALRHAADRRAALVLLPERVVGESTARIADRLAIPAIVHAAGDPQALAGALDAAVRAPQLAAAELALATARAVRAAGAEPQRAVPALATALALPMAIVDAEGVALGDAPADAPGAAPATPAPPAAATLPPGLLAPVPRTLPDPASGGLLVAAPILVAVAPEAWLVAGPERMGPWRAAAVAEALEVACAGLAGAFARRRLALERDARFRAGLLAELTALSGPPTPQLTERLVTAGWRTAGWHVGLHLGVRGASEAAPARVERLLRRHGLEGPVAPSPDGWSTWVTSDAEPSAAAYRAIVRAARALVAGAAPGLLLQGGVGAPHAGVRGLGQTLAEARHAGALADAPAVEHVGDQDGRRLLLGSLGTPSFRAYAEALLAPLAGEAALLQTLEAFLEHESSVAGTAAALGVHRNTITQRVRRAEQLLGVSLAHADERLTLRLACRVLRDRAAG